MEANFFAMSITEYYDMEFTIKKTNSAAGVSEWPA